jgi:hypothetical protein
MQVSHKKLEDCKQIYFTQYQYIRYGVEPLGAAEDAGRSQWVYVTQTKLSLGLPPKDQGWHSSIILRF